MQQGCSYLFQRIFGISVVARARAYFGEEAAYLGKTTPVIVLKRTSRHRGDGSKLS